VTVVSVQAVTKASDTHTPLPILLYALVFYSSMHDMLVSQSEVMQC
jgi:hypothetical protein